MTRITKILIAKNGRVGLGGLVNQVKLISLVGKGKIKPLSKIKHQKTQKNSKVT